jgi:ribonuclease P protein component
VESVDPTPSFGFPPAHKIKSNDDFQRAYQAKRSSADPRLIVYAFQNGLSHSRCGLSVSKKVGGAVVRNRAKRILREAYRLTECQLPSGFDFVLIPRGTVLATTLEEWKESLIALANQAAGKWEPIEKPGVEST